MATKQSSKERASAVRGHGSGFTTFIREQGVIGLAVGLAIGTAAGDTVKKFVNALISPIVQLMVGSPKGLDSAVWRVEIGNRVGDFAWGAFVSSFITLLATALVIYWLIHLMKLDRLDRKKE